jgi:tryptophan synthase beta chain
MTKTAALKLNSYRTGPDESGHFGKFGGRFVPETLMPLMLDLDHAYRAAKNDTEFRAELASFLEHYVGRPTPLDFAERLTEYGMGTHAGLACPVENDEQFVVEIEGF